ncbi:O-methyltransferase [Paraburkholderia acidiphila]|uniref:Methyltransferase domain-containing protein n=1 Tax=Paraburkholderia acidiphila TaxID=2571747 RepID=A0A7Z2JCQ3_9BURK|nr:O-methyltransferase [Paraburkholderia acidiphila]QGZ59886.1 methyltransferase domain-containing protein [Paraburkholderia acidiphila]
MNEQTWQAVDDWFCERLIGADDALDGALAASAKAGLRAINVAPNQGKFLHLLARIQGARRILEIGTLGGYSAIWLGRALPDDGSMVSLEFSPENAAVARANIARAGLEAKVKVVTGLALESLDALIAQGEAPFDFVFIDADKSNNPNYLERVLKLSRPGTVIVADNVVREGRVADPAHHEDDAVGLRRYFDMLAHEKRLETTAVQTVGSKGWDGFAITVVGR